MGESAVGPGTGSPGSGHCATVSSPKPEICLPEVPGLVLSQSVMPTLNNLPVKFLQKYMFRMVLMTVQKMPRQLCSCTESTIDCRYSRGCRSP